MFTTQPIIMACATCLIHCGHHVGFTVTGFKHTNLLSPNH